MKKSVFFALALLVSTSTLAATDHYIRREGAHVQHLKITRIGENTRVSMDVDFEPEGASEEGRKPCSAEISGEAKMVGENELVMRKQAEGEAIHCELKVHLTNTGAKVEQSPECGYFVGGICHFESEGQELIKIK
jgi:hypothetical protein